MERGVEGHAQLERYVLTGEPPTDPLARLGIDVLPTLGGLTRQEGRLYPEHKIELSLHLPVRGKIDLLDLSEPQPRVTDYKFISKPEYAKQPHQLLTDPQMIVYGAAALLGEPADSVQVEQLYFVTKGAPRIFDVSEILSRDQIEAEIAKLNTALRSMKVQSEINSAALIPGADNAPRNPICNSYGGCIFRARCAQINQNTRKNHFGAIAMQQPIQPYSPPPQYQDPAKHGLLQAFERLPGVDQFRLLRGQSATSIVQIAEGEYAQYSLEVVNRWLDCPTPMQFAAIAAQVPEERRALIEGVIWDPNQHPENRKKSAEKIEAWLFEHQSVEQQTQGIERFTKETFANPQAVAGVLHPPGVDSQGDVLLPGAVVSPPLSLDGAKRIAPASLPPHSGVVNAPDAAPNTIPQPALEPVTKVDKVGKVIAERIAAAVDGAKGTVGAVARIPSAKEAAEYLRSPNAVKIKGLSEDRARAIIEFAGGAAPPQQPTSQAPNQPHATRAPSAPTQTAAPPRYPLPSDEQISGNLDALGPPQGYGSTVAEQPELRPSPIGEAFAQALADTSAFPRLAEIARELETLFGVLAEWLEQ
jgi:hypothetical protein